MKRRLFLRGAGGAALVAPFLSSRHEREAKAQSVDTNPPLRSVIFFTHFGCLTNRWFPHVTDGPLTVDALVGTTLEQALSPFVEKLLVPRGLRSINGYGDGQMIDPWAQVIGAKLTCAEVENGLPLYATSHSLDQVIARQRNPNGVGPLVLSVGPTQQNNFVYSEILSYSAPLEPYLAVTDPLLVYSQLTGLFTGGALEGDFRVAQGESIIDLVSDDLESFQRLDMSKRDQQRVDAWLNLVRETELAMIPAGCSLERAASLGITESSVIEASQDPDGEPALKTAFTLGGDMMMNLMVLSMICDTNRSFVFSYPGEVTFQWDGIIVDAPHKGLAQRSGVPLSVGSCKTGVVEMLDQIDRWFAGKFGRLVGLLDGIDEGDVQLLDNTATMWLPEVSDGAATNVNNLPIVIAGSAGGYLKQGAVVNLESGNPSPGNSDQFCTADYPEFGNTSSTTGDVPINKLYVTLLNALGCTNEAGEAVTEFGQKDAYSIENGITDPGELSELKA